MRQKFNGDFKGKKGKPVVVITLTESSLPKQALYTKNRITKRPCDKK